MFFQLLQQRVHALGQAQPVLGGGGAGVLLAGQLQYRQADLVIKGGDGCRDPGRIGVFRADGRVDVLAGHVRRFLDIPGQQPLVQPLRQGQHRGGPEQPFDEAQPGHMPPEDQQAHGQRGRQDQPDRPPQCGPEDGRHDH